MNLFNILYWFFPLASVYLLFTNFSNKLFKWICIFAILWMNIHGLTNSLVQLAVLFIQPLVMLGIGIVILIYKNKVKLLKR